MVLTQFSLSFHLNLLQPPFRTRPSHPLPLASFWKPLLGNLAAPSSLVTWFLAPGLPLTPAQSLALLPASFLRPEVTKNGSFQFHRLLPACANLKSFAWKPILGERSLVRQMRDCIVFPACEPVPAATCVCNNMIGMLFVLLCCKFWFFPSLLGALLSLEGSPHRVLSLPVWCSGAKKLVTNYHDFNS